MRIIPYGNIVTAFLITALLLNGLKVSAQQKKVSSDDLFRQAQYEANTRQDYKTAIQLCKKALMKAPGDTDIRQLLGKLYLLTGETELSRIELKRVLARQPGNQDVLNNLISIAIYEKNYDEALGYINTALKYYPKNQELILKKADMLALMKNYSQAVILSEKLYQSFPDNKKYREAYADHLAGLSVLKLKNSDTSGAVASLEKAISLSPENKDILLYLVNINYITRDFSKSIYYCDKALKLDQRDTVFLLKKSSVLFETGQVYPASQTSVELVKLYPGNSGFRQMYINQLMAGYKKSNNQNKWDSSLIAFTDADQVIPNDSIILAALTSINFNMKKYDTCLYYSEKGLKIYPEDVFFLQHKVASLEALGKYKAASGAASKLSGLNPGNNDLKQYARMLKMKSYKNQIGLLYVHSFFDSDIKPADIASLQYIRFHGKGSIGGRVNLGRRANGDGIQLEAETYLKHNKSYYSYALAGWSPSEIFPAMRFSYSLFSNLGKGWEGELGARYLNADSINTISGVLSLGKYWKNNLTNIRGFLINDAGKWYHSYLFTNRFYLNDTKDYLSIFGSLGSIPDDRSRNFQFNSTLGFLSWSAGVGFQKTISTATTFNLTGSWTQQKTSETSSYNQYDIYISLLRMF